MTRYNESMRDHNHYTCCYLNYLVSYLKNAHLHCRVIYLMPVKMTTLTKLCMTIGWESTVDELNFRRDGMIVTLMVTSLFFLWRQCPLTMMIIMMTYVKYCALSSVGSERKKNYRFSCCLLLLLLLFVHNSIKTATTMILCNRKIWWDENWVCKEATISIKINGDVFDVI